MTLNQEDTDLGIKDEEKIVLNKKAKSKKASLDALLYYLNSFQSEGISSFIKSYAFGEIQKKPRLLEVFYSQIIFKDEEEILKIMDKYTREISLECNHYDKGWKIILPIIIKDLIEYASSSLYQAIDWDQGIEDGKEELEALYYFSHSNKRIADAIFKVILKQPVDEQTIHTNSFGKVICVGNRAYIVLHVEVQNKKTPDFGLRMFQMQYRLIDRYDVSVYSIALTSFPAHQVENFTYKVAETEIGCKFRCLNLLYFKTDEGKVRLSQMKAQKKLLPFIIEVHLFLFDADKDEEGEASKETLQRKLNVLYGELKDYTLTKEEKSSFFRYLSELLEVKGEEILGPLIGGVMQTTPSPQTNVYYEELFSQRVAEYLEKQFDMVQSISKELEARMKAEKAEIEARVKAETEVRVKAETEARVKAEADSAYNYCELRNFAPQEKIKRDDFVKLVISLGSQKASQVAHFAKAQGKNMDEVFSFICNLP